MTTFGTPDHGDNRHTTDGSWMTDKPFRRRTFLQLSTAAAGVAFLADCSSTPTVPVGESKTLDYMTFLDPKTVDPRAKAEVQIFDQLKKKEGISLKWETVPWQTLDTKLDAAVQAGRPPALSRANYYNYARHVQGNSLMSLESYAKKAFSAADLDDFVIKFDSGGEVNAFLLENIGTALYIRKDWLDELGLSAPKTWDEFIQVGKAMGAKHPDISPYLTFASTVQLGQLAYIFQSMIVGRGGKILDDKGRAAFDDKVGVETYTFLRDLVHTHHILSPDVASTTYDDVKDAFVAGRAGMIIEGSHRYALIKAALGDKVEVVKIPGVRANQPSPTMITGWTIVIPRGSSSPDNAWKALEYRISPESQELWARVASGLPTRKSVLKRPYFQTPEAQTLKWWTEYIVSDGQLVLAPLYQDKLNEIMTEAMQKVVLDPKANIESILSDAAHKYNALL